MIGKRIYTKLRPKNYDTTTDSVRPSPFPNDLVNLGTLVFALVLCVTLDPIVLRCNAFELLCDVGSGLVQSVDPNALTAAAVLDSSGIGTSPRLSVKLPHELVKFPPSPFSTWSASNILSRSILRSRRVFFGSIPETARRRICDAWLVLKMIRAGG